MLVDVFYTKNVLIGVTDNFRQVGLDEIEIQKKY